MQLVLISHATFPYTFYGYLTGNVTKLSNDAAQDKKHGVIFPDRIKISQSKIKVKNKWINLSPGMAVTVEVKTSKRSVAEYFLSPLMESGQESLRER